MARNGKKTIVTSDSPARFSIQMRMFASLLALGMLSSALMTSTLLRFVKADKITYIQDLNSDIAQHTAEAVRLSVHQYEDKMKLLVTGMSMSDLSSEQGNRVVEAIFNGYSDFVFATMRINNKVITTAVRPTLLEGDESEVAAYVASREKMVPFSDVLEGKPFIKNTTVRQDRPTFLFSVPFLTAQQSAPIVVTAEIRLAALLRVVGRSTEFESILVDRDGTVLAHPDPALVCQRADLRNLEIVKALLGSPSELGVGGTLEYSGPDGQRYLGSYAPVGVADLAVVIQKPKSVAYLAAKRLTRQLLKVTLMIAIAASLMSILMSRRLSKPIRTLSAITAKIAAGDFDIQIPIRSKDEIGDLAARFENMAHALKNREQELKDTYEQLVQSEKLAAFGQIGAGITHEIKNPLTGIIGFAQFSMRKLNDPKVLEKNLKIIEKEAKRCKDILDNLLRFTRKDKAVYELLPIDKVLTDTLDLLTHQLSTKNIEIIRELTTGDVLVEGNANQLQQVFMNMIINAEHAMKESGRLVVKTRLGASDHVFISFSDTGCGIKPEHMNRLFEPFFTTKEKGVGTGLGLSVSFGIIQQHKGKIHAESEVGKGTTFEVSFPVSDGALPASATCNASSPA